MRAMRIGYARVSTDEQNLDLQRDALWAAGCDAVFEDAASGAKSGRPGLMNAVDHCRAGDILIVWKLDRLGRSLVDLVRLAEDLSGNGVGLKVLTGSGANIDTSQPDGRMIFAILAALAEFERELIRERTKAGIQAARRRGVALGRPRKLTAAQVRQAQTLIDSRQATWRDIARQLGVHVSTLRRGMRKYG